MTTEQEREVRAIINIMLNLVADVGVTFTRLEDVTNITVRAVKDALREPEPAIEPPQSDEPF